MLRDAQKVDLARLFLTALRTGDSAVLHDALAKDVVWQFPGSSAISGEVHGTDGVRDRVSRIYSAGVRLELMHILIGCSGVAVSLRNKSGSETADVDQHITTILTIQGRRVTRIDTFALDLCGLNRFFSN